MMWQLAWFQIGGISAMGHAPSTEASDTQDQTPERIMERLKAKELYVHTLRIIQYLNQINITKYLKFYSTNHVKMNSEHIIHTIYIFLKRWEGLK